MNSTKDYLFNKYVVLLLFVVFSIILSFPVRFISGFVFTSHISNDILCQFSDAMYLAMKSMAAYLGILCVAAILGFLIAKAKGKIEVAKGFKYALVFCGILVTLYFITVFAPM